MPIREINSKNKRESLLIKKKNRKTAPYICCDKPSGNSNKIDDCHYCCGYPMVYKRMATTCYNKKMCRDYDCCENN